MHKQHNKTSRNINSFHRRSQKKFIRQTRESRTQTPTLALLTKTTQSGSRHRSRHRANTTWNSCSLLANASLRLSRFTIQRQKYLTSHRYKVRLKTQSQAAKSQSIQRPQVVLALMKSQSQTSLFQRLMNANSLNLSQTR